MRRLGFYDQYRKVIADNAPAEEFVEGLADKILSGSACDLNGSAEGKDEPGSILLSSNSRSWIRNHKAWSRTIAAAVFVLGIGLFSFVGIGDRYMSEAEAGRCSVDISSIKLVEPETTWIDSDGETVRVTAIAEISVRNPRHENAAIVFGPDVEVSPNGREDVGDWRTALDLGTRDNVLTVGLRVAISAADAEDGRFSDLQGNSLNEESFYAADLFVRCLCDSKCILSVDGRSVVEAEFEVKPERPLQIAVNEEPIHNKKDPE